MTTFNKIVAWISIAIFWTINSSGQSLNDQNTVYSKFIATKLSEKYRIPSENAAGGVPSNPLQYTNINGYGLASFTYPFDGSVIQRNASGYATFSIAGRIEKALIDNGYSDFKVGLVQLNVTTGNPSGASNFVNINLNAAPNNAIVGNTAIFNLISTNIYQGWYLLVLQGTKNGTNVTLSSTKFGIGDVFIIAGQSNARGVQNQGVVDNVTSYYNNGQAKPDGLRILQASRPTFSGELNGAFEKVNLSYSQNLLKRIRLENGLPHFRKFDRMDYYTNAFTTGQITNSSGFQTGENITFTNYEQIVYPFGGASWAYMPLGKKWIQEKGVPVCFFNFAINDSSIDFWQKNYVNTGDATGFESNYTILKKFLNFHGRYSGFRGILWYQGEKDITGGMLQNDYNTRINQMMSDLGTDTGLGINWFISKVSYSVNLTNFGEVISTTIPAAQNSATVSLPSKKILGVDDATNSPYSAINNAGTRGSGYNIHFTGSHLENLGNRWYDALSNNISSATPTVYQGLYSAGVSYNSGSNSYTLTAPTGYNEYRWVKDEGDIENSSHYTSGNTKVVTGGIADREVWTCFMKQSTWKAWDMCAPFVVPNTKDTEMSLTIPTSKTLAQNGSSDQILVDAAGVTWTSSIIYNQGTNWLSITQNSTGSSGRYNLGYIFSTNNSGSQRSAKIRITGQGILGNTIVKDFDITQIASSITTPLTSLNPTSTSGGYQINKSFGNITMKIADTQYTQGIGVHANSSLTYNLGGQYDTFNFKIGQDDESNCGDGVQFSIKADGVTIYGPVTKTYGQAATVQSVSVSGKNTLELIVNMGANDYCDHADWADVYLQSGSGGCGTPPIAPTSVSASPSSINSGGSSTLSASCAYGTVTWSTGATGNSISVSPGATTNYTVKCVSPGCPDSPVVGVTVNVSNSPCETVTNNLTMGTWNVNSDPLIARYFHNQYWLTQRIGTNPEKFLVRGSNMLTRGDVTLNNGSYSSLTTCFGWQNSDYGGLAVPNSTQFPTPAGFTLDYESDGTPFYTANGSCGLTAPTSVSASPASISSGQSSTLSATCATGTRLWSTGATSATIVVSPTSTTTYTVKCTQAGCPDSPTSSVTVQVGPCASLSHNLVMGTWNVMGHQLVAKYYHNQWWLVQRIATNPEKFLVRGSEMLTRGDVTLTNGSYSSLVGCFGWTYSAYNGLGTPNSTQFPTPSGWQYDTEPDGTPFYTSTGGARIAADQDFIKETVPSFISVYPNPNQGTFSVKVYLETASSLDIDLINSSGKIYQSIKVDGNEGQNEIPFTTQNISGGNYLIRVKTKDKVESTVVVIR